MTDQQKPSDTRQDDLADDARHEAGEREQGELTENSDDLSSPQLTERRDDGTRIRRSPPASRGRDMIAGVAGDKGYAVVRAADADDAYAGSDVPGEVPRSRTGSPASRSR